QQWGFHRTANATTAALVGAALGRDRAQGALPQWPSRSMRWGRRTLRATEPETCHDPRTPHAALPRSAPGVAAAPRRAPGRRPGAGGAGGARRQPLARCLAAVAGGEAAGRPVGAARVPPPARAPRRRRPGAPAAAARAAGAALASVPGVVEGAGSFLAAQRDQFGRAPELVELGRVARDPHFHARRV